MDPIGNHCIEVKQIIDSTKRSSFFKQALITAPIDSIVTSSCSFPFPSILDRVSLIQLGNFPPCNSINLTPKVQESKASMFNLIRKLPRLQTTIVP